MTVGPYRFVCASLLTTFVLLAGATPALAQKTDVVTLVNGDTLTCEIKLLDRGRLFQLARQVKESLAVG